MIISQTSISEANYITLMLIAFCPLGELAISYFTFCPILASLNGKLDM